MARTVAPVSRTFPWPLAWLLAPLGGVVFGCASGLPSLTVEVSSDLRAGEEVSVAQVEVAATPFEDDPDVIQRVERPLSASDDLAADVRVAELFVTGAPVQHVRVRLLDALGRVRALRQVRVQMTEDRTVRVTLSRGCVGVVCPAGPEDPDDATVCVNGACVSPACSPGDAQPDRAAEPGDLEGERGSDACRGADTCALDSDCAGARGCQRALCRRGECLYLDQCPAGERCGAGGACEPAPRCGDGTCDPGSETACACPDDCGPCPLGCGDGVCDDDEHPTCPADCGPPQGHCGDGICEVELESRIGCAEDCDPRSETAAPVCGDDRCEGFESCAECPECCEETGCGDGVCDATERPCGCEADCGPCPVCGDGICDLEEPCEEDCASGAPVCGDGVCTDELESCASCEADCGWCTGYPGWGPDPGCSPEEPAAAGPVCDGIPGAWTNDAVNVGYYPMEVAAPEGTEVLSGDVWDGGRGAVLLHLEDGSRFAAQSARNPSCREAPPLRPARDGWVFGYAPAADGGGPVAGWVLASDLVLDRSGGREDCVHGPAERGFQLRLDPYSRGPSCAVLECAGQEALRTCAMANPAGEGAADCGGQRLDLSRSVQPVHLPLRYAPHGPVRRYLHAGDRVRVLYRSGGSPDQVFVEVEHSGTPTLTPLGSRGWVDAEQLVER